MTLPSATEYFVSYYDCTDRCDKDSVRIKCLEHSDNCPNWRLRYRCRLGNLDKKGLEYFDQNSGINYDDCL